MKDFGKMVFGSCLGVILASIVVFFIFFAMLGSAINGVVKSFSKEKEVKSVSSESVLMLDLTGSIKDTAPVMSFEFGDNEKTNYTLPEILRAITIAKSDPDIEAIVVNLERASINFATAKEIRDALKDFQESGKKVYAYSDHYSYLNYYISSVANEVMAGPEGSLNITGLTSTTIFKKGLLKKLGVEMQVFKVGTFKGAVEPYILDRLSEANRLQISEFLQGLWQGTTREMADSRGVDPSVFQRYADEAYFLEKISVAKELNLVDTLVYRIDLQDVLADKIFNDASLDINYVHIEDVLPLNYKSEFDDKIAVIYAEGNIVVGTGDEEKDYFNTEAVITEKIVKKLREAAEDDDIKAIVMRVNSGGGAVTTSELICHEVDEVKKIKPVVVSMGDYAASGGYYISSHASSIVANPYTLTGSIGIFGMFPNAAGTMDKLGLKEQTVATSETGVLSVSAPLNPKLATGIQKSIERGYGEFTTRVATGRGMTVEQVDSIGQGRVWLGEKAIELGLVDKIGGIDVAIREAARLAELDEYSVIDLTEQTDLFEEIFGFSLSKAAFQLRLSDVERLNLYKEQLLKDLTGIKAMPPYDITMVGEAACETNALSPTM